MTQLDSGDEIIYMVPNYLQIFHLARSFGIKVNILPIRQETNNSWESCLSKLNKEFENYL